LAGSREGLLERLDSVPKNKRVYGRVEFSTYVTYIFWDVTLRSPVKVNQTIQRTYLSACRLLNAGYLFVLLFDPEDGGDIFLLHLELQPEYMTSHPKRYEGQSVNRLQMDTKRKTCDIRT
jgi:hypothetical protein